MHICQKLTALKIRAVTSATIFLVATPLFKIDKSSAASILTTFKCYANR